MWARVDLDRPRDVSRVIVDFGKFYHDHAPLMKLEALIEDRWETVIDDITGRLDKFRFENGHPVYGYTQRTLKFEPVRCTALRLVIKEAAAKWAWTICELEVYHLPDE